MTTEVPASCRLTLTIRPCGQGEGFDVDAHCACALGWDWIGWAGGPVTAADDGAAHWETDHVAARAEARAWGQRVALDTMRKALPERVPGQLVLLDEAHTEHDASFPCPAGCGGRIHPTTLHTCPDGHVPMGGDR